MHIRHEFLINLYTNSTKQSEQVGYIKHKVMSEWVRKIYLLWMGGKTYKNMTMIHRWMKVMIPWLKLDDDDLIKVLIWMKQQLIERWYE